MDIIAIDGPAGSGKSTVAREISLQTDYYYFDSGAYYRAVTVFFYQKFQENKKSESFEEWLNTKVISEELLKIDLKANLFKEKENEIFLNDNDISNPIRMPDITNNIKFLAPLKEIRDFVNHKLHILSNHYNLIMDGRDIGTEVFPNAKFKFFLTADPKLRAERRWKELKEKGIEIDINSLHNDIVQRDESDRTRKIAPLKQANDAILIDTTNLSKNVVINMILSRI
jgi:CMP/dCMP kinase